MRTSKKLLSLFLAVVMVVTTCSVGFTAFAADGNKTDTNGTYWNNNTDTKKTFDALNMLVDELVPLLTNGALKETLEGLGMTVDENTGISEVVAGVSPTLMSLLSGTSDKEEIVNNFYSTHGYNQSTYASTNSKYYDYLTDDQGLIDFFTLYDFCLKNNGKSGISSELQDYIDENLPKLETLFEAHIKAITQRSDKFDASENFIMNCADTLGNEGYAFDPLTIYDIENASFNGSPFKDYTNSAADYSLKHYNKFFEIAGSDYRVDSIAKCFYYEANLFMANGIEVYVPAYAKMATLGGANITYSGKTLTADNYNAQLRTVYTFSDYCNDMGINESTLSGSAQLSAESGYNSAIENLMGSILVPDTSNLSTSPYYEEMCKGALILSGYYKDLEALNTEINGFKVTDEQLGNFVDLVMAWPSITSQNINDLFANKNPFSAPVGRYLQEVLGSGNYLDIFITARDENNLGLTREQKIESIKAYVLNDGDQSVYESGTTLIQRADIMISSQLLSSLAGANKIDGFYGYSPFSALEKEIIFETLKPEFETKSYKYADYKIADELTVEYVNNTINGYINDYLDPHTQIGGLVDALLKRFVQSDIDLYGALKDIWLNLYEKPVETVFNLVPILTIVVDELLVPLVFNEKPVDEGDLYTLLVYDKNESATENAKKLLYNYSSAAGNTEIGLDALSFDLNKMLPAILNWLLGNEIEAYDAVGNYTGSGFDNNVPKFTNIYVADKALYGAHLNGGLAKTLKNGSLQDNPDLADAIDDVVTKIATTALEAFEDFATTYNKPEDTRYTVQGDVACKGLNNLFVALPELIDILGQKYKENYGVDSDWTFIYPGKIVEVANGEKTQKENTVVSSLKALATENKPELVLEHVVNTLIGEWINALLDIINDTIVDENNIISANIPVVQGLLSSLGALGEKSIITDVFNGLFQLKRSDDATFTLEQRANGFVGFSKESGMFLLSNILYVDENDNKQKGLVPFISSIITPSGKADYKIGNAWVASAPLLASSKKANKSAAGTNYDELLTKDNVKAAQSLIDVLDKTLSSLLENTTVNGFKLDSTDNILSAVATAASAYLGAKNTNDIVKLINNYLYFIVGENKGAPSTTGKIGTLPTKDGDVDKKKVYTSSNLSVLVIQTYSLIENIVDYLFYNETNGVLADRDPNMLIADALYGVVSPDAVAVRLDNYPKTAKILQDKDYLNWNSFKVQIAYANNTEGNYQKDYLKYGFANGDKEAFYDALGESLSSVAAIIGTLLTKTYTDASRSGNYYSELIYPVLSNVANAMGASGVMSPAAFNKATAPQQLIKGLITPLGSMLDQIYDAPVSCLLNFIKGVSGLLDDDSIKGIIYNAIAPITNIIQGVANVAGLLSPKLAGIVLNLASGISDIGSSLPNKDIIVSLINGISISGAKLSDIFELPSINWKKLAAAKSPAEVLLLIYAYLVDSVLNSDLISGIVDSLAPDLTNILKKLSAAQILTILSDVIAVVQSPTEVYWTFAQYAGKLTKSFTYPRNVTASEASNAVDQLDDLVNNVFPLLNSLGVTDIEGLGALVNDNLYTNEILTTIAKGLYGALTGNSTVTTILEAVGLDVSPKGYAAYLTDKSYGKTYSSAAKTLKKAKSWNDVKKLNWGFKNGTSKAQTGFVNGLAAVLRPLNGLLSVFLAEGKISGAVDLDIEELIKSIDTKGKTTYGEGEYGGTLEYKIKNGMVDLKIRSNVLTSNENPTTKSEIKIDLTAIIKDVLDALSGVKVNIGTNGYENAVIPILEAFMCDGVKTYKQYKKDYKKAKDNLLIDILKPIAGLIDDVTDKPFDTLTAILPNVAYFIDSNGIEQAVGNLLAPLTAKDGVIGVLKKDGLDLDKFITSLFAKDLGSIVADALKIDADIKINLTNFAATNVHDMVIPLVQGLLKDRLGITLPDFDFATIASHGKIKTVKSAAKNSKGKYTTRQVQSNQGETLVAVLRYISNTLIKNASALKKIIGNIDAIKKNSTLKNIINSVFNQIAGASKDDIVRAVFYLLAEDATDTFFDYRDFKYDDSYTFTFGDMDEDFCRQLAPMLDGLIGGLLEGGLSGLVTENVYKDSIISSIATGLYGAVEGVKINDDIGSLANLLKMTDIDFTTSNVASLLTNSKYGQTYPAAASVIRSAGSWSKVNADNLKWGVKDRDSFLNALAAVLRPIYGVLDVILNDASLNIFDLIKIPGSDGYTSTIVPLLEAFGCYNIKTQYQYREDIYKAYDNILLDILNPIMDKVEDVLNAPLETVMDILPNLSLFFANDGLLQIVDNLLTPVSALLEALKPIVNINEILDAAGLDVAKLLKDAIGIKLTKFDLYDLPGTLKPLVGADNVVNTLNTVLGVIKINGAPLGLVLPEIDWFRLASHGDFVLNATSQAATYGKRIAVKSDQDETLIALLRFLINTINYKDNYNVIVNLVTGLLGDDVSDGLKSTINDVLGMLKGDADTVIADLVDLLQSIVG